MMMRAPPRARRRDPGLYHTRGTPVHRLTRSRPAGPETVPYSRGYPVWQLSPGTGGKLLSLSLPEGRAARGTILRLGLRPYRTVPASRPESTAAVLGVGLG
eukprot:747898-Hanusia_phi.AAC.1